MKPGEIKRPALEGIEGECREAKWVERVTEALQKRAVMRIPAPTAIAALMNNIPMACVYQRAKPGVKGVIIFFGVGRVFF